MRIRKKDRVKVIYGGCKGAIGTVLMVFPRENKVLVEGVNKVTRHKKGSEGGSPRVKEMPLHISQVALVDENEAIVRVGFSRNKEGVKIRVNKATGKEIPVNS